MKYTYILPVVATLLISCNNSGQKQAQAPKEEFDKQKEEQAIRQMVDDVYKEVNIRWDESNEGTEFEETMEEKYTTEDWQKLYLDLRAIEAEKVAVGNDEGTYFSEGGNVWTMGSFDQPFTTEIVRVEFADSKTADVYFWLIPAGNLHLTESDAQGPQRLPILWQMRKVDDKWLIQNFIEGDEDYDYEYDYTEHMKDYIKRNREGA